MIIYIHGFGSSGKGYKVEQMRHWFAPGQLLSPSLPYIPELAMDTLEQLLELLIAQQQEVKLIGSSLGGFYALCLAQKYQLPAVLINPAITPHRLLKQALGHAKHYFDDSYFLFTREHLKTLEQLKPRSIERQEKILLLVQQKDEVIDYREALTALPQARIDIDQQSDHGYGNIADKKELILSFLNGR